MTTTELPTLQKALLAIKKLKKQLKEQQSKPPEPIAIVGLGCRFPTVMNKNEFWQLLTHGRNIISQMPNERWQLLSGTSEQTLRDEKHPYWGGFLENIADFDAYFFGITPREAIQMDPHQRLLLQVAYEAIEDAGLPLESLAGSNTGVFASLYARQTDTLQEVDLELDALYLPTGNAISIAANRLSYFFDLHGPSIVLDTACSSSLVALHLACLHLQTHLCEQALVCGAHINLSPSINLILSKAHMLSPHGQCRTFDAHANGYVQGEGVGVIVLKPLSKALQNKDRIYAVIMGSAVNQDGKTNGLTAPNGLQQEALLKAAYATANINPSDISYIECHGTGTFLGDPIELQALGEVVSKDRPPQNPCWIGSVKTNLGHLEPAAGIASIIKVALALQHSQIPPHLNFSTPNPHIGFEKYHFQIPQTIQPWPQYGSCRTAGISGFGFGGTNAHIVVRELLPHEKMESPQSSSVNQEIFTLSAKNPAALYDLIHTWRTYLTNQPNLNLAQLCYNTHLRRTHYSCRLAIVAATISDLYHALSLAELKEARLEQSNSIFLTLTNKTNSTNIMTENPSNIDIITLAKIYVENTKINWEEYEKNRSYPCIDMPLYPWQNKVYWPSSKNKHAELSANKTDGFYPFYAKQIDSPLDVKQFEFIFHTAFLPEIQDTFNVLHAGYYLDMLAFASKKLYHQTAFTIENLSFLRALIVPTNTRVFVQLLLETSSNHISFSFYSCPDSQSLWQKHAEGKLSLHTISNSKIKSLAEIKQRCLATDTIESLYNRITAMGMPAGNSIRWTQRYWLGEKEILCEFRQPESITQHDAFTLTIHPGIIDGSIQPLFKILPSEFTHAFIATKIDRLTFFSVPEGPLYLHSTLNEIHPDEKNIHASWVLFNNSGHIAVECENICLRQLDSPIQIESTTQLPLDLKSDSNPAEQKQRIIHFLTEHISKIFSMPAADIDIHQSLHHMGMDSLLAMTLTTFIETSLDTRYPLDAMLDNPTIEKMATFIMQNKQRDKKSHLNNLFISYRKIQPSAKIRLFCFPYGGAGASVYREWQQDLPETIEVCPIQLPGRENRLDERPLTDMHALIDAIANSLEPELNLPFAFFGHSLGALIGFELTRKLRQYDLPQPFHLFISAFPAPNTPTTHLDHLLKQLQENNIHLSTAEIDLSNEQLIRLATILNEHGVFDYDNCVKNKEVIQALLPCFLGDMQLVKSYHYREMPPLELPITLFYSHCDPWAPASETLKWETHTREKCTIHEFDSGHLFIKEKAIKKQILQHVTNALLSNIPSHLSTEYVGL